MIAPLMAPLLPPRMLTTTTAMLPPATREEY